MKKIITTFFTAFLILSFSSLASAATIKASNLNDLQSQIISNMTNGVTSIVITYTGATPSNIKDYFDSISNTIENAQKNLPDDVYWNISSLSLGIRGNIGNAQITVTVNYRTTPEQDAYVNQKVKEITASIIKPEMNNYQKEKAIHDYIVSTIDYVNSGDISHTAYSALYKRQAVCQGYSILAYKLLNAAGIENKIVAGYTDGDESQGHMWNDVNLDGKWYMLDITWDDPLPNAPGVRSSKFFNVTNDFLKTNNHSWVESDYPIANTAFVIPTYNNNLTAATRSVEAAENAVTKAETFRNLYDIYDATKLVASLPNGAAKTELTNRLNTVYAVLAVEKAEKYKLPSYINNAISLVNSLPERTAKTALLKRLGSIKAFVRR